LKRFEHGGDIYGNPGVALDFSVNTNPLGMPDGVRLALISHADEYVSYPDPQCRKLRSAIALHEGLPKDMILCGNGAADLIYRLCYAMNLRRALVCAPTFSEYERALEQVGCEVMHHALKPDNEFRLREDIEDLLVPGVDVLFLCHPNNPTGCLIHGDIFERILRRAQQNRTKVIVDESFLDFSDGISFKRYIKEIPGLVVVKAFTKIYAMAGLRLGYLLTSDTQLLDKAIAAAQCWSVSVPAQIAGVAALACEGWLDKTRCIVAQERRFLSGCLGEVGIKVFPSEANFLLLQCERQLYAPLLERGILIRSCENFRGLDSSYYRIGVKTHPENICLIQAIREMYYL